MAASIHNLQTQARSLQAYTEALQVTGRNIAGSSDPNYSRQEVFLQSTVAGSHANVLGSSVNAAIKDTRNQLVEAQIWREQSDLSFSSQHLAYLEQLELSLYSGSDAPLEISSEGGDALNSGLISDLENFFTSWADLEASPNDLSVQQAVLQSAQSLMDRLHTEARSLVELESTISNSVSGDVETVNQQLSGIASIQAQISRLPTGSDAAKAGLISLRDQRLSELSEYISFTWTDNSASPLESSLSVRLTDGTTANLIQGSSVLDTLEVSGGSVVLANAGSTLVADGGRIGAANQLLQNELPVYTGQRDLIASELVTLVNGIYNPSGAEGQNFFDPDTATAASISLEVQSASAIVAGTDGSGNDIAREIAAIRKQDLSSIGSGVFSGTFSDVLLNEQSSLAYKIDSARDSASAQESVLEFLEQEKSSSSGVDLDYEVTQLLQFQRAYQATSRVLRTLDEVMQTFLSDIS